MTNDGLPQWNAQEILPVATRPLGILTADLVPHPAMFQSPRGARKIVQVAGGSLIGPRIRARVLPGGGDWALELGDGVLTLDVRLLLETEDGATIFMTYEGMRHAPPEIAARLAKGEKVDPSAMYFRTIPRFETGDARYAWLNRIICVGVGERLQNGPRYHLHEVL